MEECKGLAEVGGAVDVSYPTYMVWGSNTGVGKTLISAGESIVARLCTVELRCLPRRRGIWHCVFCEVESYVGCCLLICAIDY